MKILVADDDPINRRLLKEFLDKGDYEVILARDGDEAWSILRQADSPKLAILDWFMPGMARRIPARNLLHGESSIRVDSLFVPCASVSG
jgi:CheY-like chemotaxis protein